MKKAAKRSKAASTKKTARRRATVQVQADAAPVSVPMTKQEIQQMEAKAAVS